MKIGIYDPYLDTLGGGERYIAQISKCLSNSHNVVLFWEDPDILGKIEKRFGFSLPKVQVSDNIFSKDVSLRTRLFESRGYDVIFFISDGSFPFLLSKKVFPILQYPIKTSQKGIKNTLKFRRISHIICYSEFVRKHLEENFPVSVTVINPAVGMIGRGEKRKIILSVGRFTRGKNEKNQEALIDFFKKNSKSFQGWKLVLAGGALGRDEEFVKSLEEKAKDYPIQLLSNISYEKLSSLYKSAKIYWHAAGFGKDISTNPETAEHFGITTVEAMSAGCVPVVFNGGGLTEIVRDGVDGYLWSDFDSFLKKTLSLMKDEKKWTRFCENAVERAKDFSEEEFCHKINGLIKSK